MPKRTSQAALAQELAATRKDLAELHQGFVDYRALAKSLPGVGLPEIPSVNINQKAQAEITSFDALFASITANAGPNRDRFKLYPGNNLTPTALAGIMRQADLGIVQRWQELIQQALKRDARLASVHRGRVVAVIGRPYSIRPCQVRNPEDLEIAVAMSAFIQECLDGISGWKRGLRFLLSAPCAGYASVEPIYRYRHVRFPFRGKQMAFDALGCDELRRVHGKHFKFNTDQTSDTPLPKFGRFLQIEGQTPLLDLGAGTVYLPRHKFIFHTSGDEGLIQERGWMRTAIWLHSMKQRVISLWIEFLNRFGIPNVRGSVPFNIWTDKARSLKYAKFLEIFGDGFPTLLPSDLKIDVDQYQAGGTSRDAFASFIGWVDTQSAILVQGEHLTTEIGDAGSYNAADTQAQEKKAIVEYDDEELDETVRDQLFWSLIDLNKDDLSYMMGVPPHVLLRNRPHIVFRLDARTSRKERMEEFKLYQELGGKITVRQVQDEGGFDPAGPGEDVLEGPKTQLFPGGGAGADRRQVGP